MWTCFLNSEFHAMMMKNEQVAGCTGAAPGLQHARVALLVCVLDVKSAVSQIAAARLVSTLRWMQKLESLKWWFPPLCGLSAHYWCCIQAPPPTFEKKASIVFVFFILNMNFQSLGLSVFAVLIDWFRTSNSVIYFLHLYFSYVWYLFFISIIEFIYHHFPPKELYC